MSEPCLDLIPFADGELEPERAEAFRSHLQSCEACRSGLLEAIPLGVRLGALPPPPKDVTPTPQARAESPPVLLPAPTPVPLNPALGKRRRIPYWTTAALAVAAVLLVVIFWRPPRPPPAPPNVFAVLTARPYDIRVAYPDAAPYRPTREQMRGSSSPSNESFSYAVLDAFQKRKDGYALAIAKAWNGEDLTKVAEQLRKLEPKTPSIRGDLAAIQVLNTHTDNAESVLAELEALRSSDDLVVARAARWNYALLLSRLDLPLSAAQAFRAIASENEPGWADEARQRAEPEERRGQDFWTKWERAYQAGETLVKAGTPVPTDLVKAFPGVLRASFYNAVRAAPNRERVLALAPMAAELDRFGDQRILSEYVERVAKLDFHRRAPLADAFARLLKPAPLTAEAKRELTAANASSDIFDIVMGAMVELEVIPNHLESFRKMASQTGDPWFEIVLARAEATVDVQHSNWLGAEARLRKAEKLCSSAVTYQCLSLEGELGKLYQDLHRVHDSLAVLRDAVRTARSVGEWSRYRRLLWQLADAERFHSSTATVRAHANEILLMADSCDYKSSANRSLAGAALLDVDGRAARRYLDEALRCGAPDLVTANLLTDIARLDPQPGDLTQLQDWLSKLRNNGTPAAAQQALTDEIEGRLVIERDRAAGTLLLERAIAAAETLPHDVTADKARAGAYSVLALDAARQGDHARVLTLIAQDLGLPPPGACTVGMVAEDERAGVVVRGADGKDRGAYEASRGRRSSAVTVSAELAQGLAGCAHVQVMAPAALQGQPHVLPARLPWSYASGAHGHSGSGKQPTEPRTLIVTNVVPPTYLKLPPLLAQEADRSASATFLSGPDATPTRVLAEMAGDSEIQFHTHALMDVGVSDASHLVLSPEPNGNYALTAEAIRRVELRGHPIIVLAACHSAQGARYQHAPWSLPDAFLAVGARAVFATATDVPDREAGPFFAGVLARVRTGADPAAALRDERMTVLATNPSSWVADVILFE